MDSTSDSFSLARQWHLADIALKAVRHEELRQLSDEDAALSFISLADFVDALPRRSPNTTSGFVEQQRLFKKLRRL